MLYHVFANKSSSTKNTISTGSIKFSTWLALELRYHNWKQMLLEYNWPVLIFKKYIIENIININSNQLIPQEASQTICIQPIDPWTCPFKTIYHPCHLIDIEYNPTISSTFSKTLLSHITRIPPNIWSASKVTKFK